MVGRPAAVLIGLSMLVGCRTGPVEPPPSGTTFVSRRGNFTVVVPPLLRPGARLVETYEGDNTFVSFSDDLHRLLRIEVSPTPPEHLADLTGPRRTELMGRVLDQVLMPVEYGRVSPDAAVVYRQDVDTAAGRALYAVVTVPGDSTRSQSNPDGTSPRPEITRGLVLFPAAGSVYVVSDQELPLWRSTHPQASLDERANRLLEPLQQAVASMTFH